MKRLDRGGPAEPLLDSYLGQRYRLWIDGTKLLLVPAGDDRFEHLPAFPSPFADAVHLLTAWNPGGAAGTFEEFQLPQDGLTAEVARRGRPVTQATGVAGDDGWFEPYVVVAGLSDEEAVRIAAVYEQPVVLRWHDQTIRVQPAGLNASVGAGRTAVRLYRLPSATRPVRRDVDPSGRCVTWGGPWISASIHAAALWQHHRAVGVRLALTMTPDGETGGSRLESRSGLSRCSGMVKPRTIRHREEVPS